MRLVLFRDGRPVSDAIQVGLEHVSADLQAFHTCYGDGDGKHDEHEAQVYLHEVTDAHLQALYEAIGVALGHDQTDADIQDLATAESVPPTVVSPQAEASR